MPNIFSPGYALLIGIGADLPVTVQDAQAFYDVLIAPDRAAYPPEQTELLTEAEATRTHILKAFDRLAKRANSDPQSTAIVYYSGHGGRIKRGRKPPEYFLVPYGCDPAKLQTTAISGLEFTKKIEAIKSRKLLIILDCCHAGGVPALKQLSTTFVKSPVPSTLLDVLGEGSGRVVIASSRDDEYSYTGLPYSIFTTCFIEALAGQGAVKRDGFARILDVLIYLFEQVPKRTADQQHPFVKKMLDLGDNFAICYYAGGSKAVTGEVAQVAPTPRPARLLAIRRKQLQNEHDEKEAEWTIRSDKVKQLRSELAILASGALRFQLEKEILYEEARIARLVDRMEEIDQTLAN
jgi:hypothetical protein